MKVTRLGAEVDPPSNTRQIAVRTGKRVSQTQPDHPGLLFASLFFLPTMLK
jgi:hypothetical protein